MGKPLLFLRSIYKKKSKLIPGTDGEKMSKSKNNVINIFASEKELKKQIQSIKTDSTALEKPKDWKSCNLFKIYSLIASNKQIEAMKTNYQKGGYGYGHGKKDLVELILNKYSKEREKYNYYISNPNEVEKILIQGSLKAKTTAGEVLNRVRKKLGY